MHSHPQPNLKLSQTLTKTKSSPISETNTTICKPVGSGFSSIPTSTSTTCSQPTTLASTESLMKPGSKCSIPQTTSCTSQSPILTATSGQIKSLICKICQQCYTHRSALFKHMKRCHPTFKCSKTDNIKCLEEKCSFSCRYISDLRKHLTTAHCMHYCGK